VNEAVNDVGGDYLQYQTSRATSEQISSQTQPINLGARGEKVVSAGDA